MLDFNRISTIKDLKTIPQAKIETISKEALKLAYSSKHLDMYGDKFKNEVVLDRIMEVVFTLGTHSFAKDSISNYKNYTFHEKNLLAALSFFDGKEELIVSALASQNINFTTVYTCLRLIDKLKGKPQVSDDLNMLMIVMRYISQTYFGIDDSAIILTKLSEMLLYKKELFKTNGTTK